ncbi:MAG: VTT domain-containing protein [Polyangiales bacterium]
MERQLNTAPRSILDGLVTRVRALAPGALRALKARFIDLEYRVRIARPFTYGDGAPRVFYPGCSLTAADPELVMRAYAWLRARDPSIALWSDCCGMPVEKFSSAEAAERSRERTRRQIRSAGTQEIITACGNCTVQFNGLDVPGLRVTSLYKLLAEEDWGPRPASGPVVVHHPCSARIDKDQQVHFRSLAGRLNLRVVNADEKKHPLACCLVTTPSAVEKRKALAEQSLVTYCAHCTMAFQRDVPTRHVLQEVFGRPDDRWRPRGKVERFGQYLRFARDAARRFPHDALALPAGGAPSRSTPLRLLGAVAAGVGLAIAAARGADLPRHAVELATWSSAAGPGGALVFALAYILATVLALPGSVLTLAAGFAWGPRVGFAVVMPVAVAAATAAFLLGRTLLRGRVERLLGRDARLAAIDQAIARDGLRMVLLLRLSPVFPFSLLNYALALSRVSVRDYLLGTALGMLPGAALYVYLGSVVSHASELVSGSVRHTSPLSAALYWVGLAATAAAALTITRSARAGLREALATARA